MNDNAPSAPAPPGRKRLDNRRPAERIPFRFREMECTALVGLRVLGQAPEGHLVVEMGDVFINAGKDGTDIEALAQTGAVLISLGLQHGVDIRAMQHSIPRLPDGRAGDLIGAAIDAIVAEYYGGGR